MSKTIFIHFCGTDTTTKQMTEKFGQTIKADVHIYFNGPGASRSFVENFVEKCPEANNSYYSMIEQDGTKIITVEKKWRSGSSMTGISEDDSDKTAKYMAYIFENLDTFGLEKKALFHKKSIFVIAGHSRGAAACLPSWIGTLPPNFFPNAHLVPLDPVAGQTGNSYNIGNTWTTFATPQNSTPILYEVFRNAASHTCTVTEIWAKAAKSAAAMQRLFFDKLKSYNPARKFLIPAEGNLDVSFRRASLGYSHSAMVGLDARYDPYYGDGIAEPYAQLVDFFNALISTGQNDFDFHDLDYETLLEACNNDGDLSDRYGDRWLATFENQVGQEVAFQTFVDNPL